MKSEAMINRDKPLFADMEYYLLTETGSVLYDSETALLVKDDRAPVYMLAADDVEEGKRIIDGIEEETYHLVVRGDNLVEYCREKGFRVSEPCTQVVYGKKELLDESGELEIRHPSEEDFPSVLATYSLLGEEGLRENFESDDFFGGYVDGKFVCYGGLHEEGALGLLHVFEDYRGRGYANQIASFLINRQVKLGRIPYGQVFVSNAASLGLQKKLGMTFSEGTICWTHKERK